MKITEEDNGVFRMELTDEDGSEDEVAFQIRAIVHLAQNLESHGITAADRAQDRGGNWRYSQIEKALGLIRDSAETALQHIKLIDFPSNRNVQ